LKIYLELMTVALLPLSLTIMHGHRDYLLISALCCKECTIYSKQFAIYHC